MKKVLVVFTSAIPTYVQKFAIDMAKEHAWLLHGIFLDNAASPILYLSPGDIAPEVTNMQENEKLVDDNMQTFSFNCQTAGVLCEKEKNTTLEQLIKYSSSAEAIITDAHITFFQFSLTTILTDAHCPVCLVSEAASAIKHVILTYDGSNSSKYAIEQFMIVFPKLSELPTYLVSINPELEVLEHKEFINQILPDYFPNYTLKLLEGNVKKELDKFVQQYPDNTIVVLGAFGRTAISRLFHPSLAKEILNETKATVFIAHN